MKIEGQSKERQVDEDVVEQGGAKHHRQRRFSCVKALEKTAAEDAVINHRRAKNDSRGPRGINTAFPDSASKRIEVFGVFAREKGFCLAIAGLLFEVRVQSRAPVVPHESCRRKPDLPAARL